MECASRCSGRYSYSPQCPASTGPPPPERTNGRVCLPWRRYPDVKVPNLGRPTLGGQDKDGLGRRNLNLKGGGRKGRPELNTEKVGFPFSPLVTTISALTQITSNLRTVTLNQPRFISFVWRTASQHPLGPNTNEGRATRVRTADLDGWR